MYKIKCEKEFFSAREVVIPPSGVLLDAYGNHSIVEVKDEDGKVSLETLLNNTGADIIAMIEKNKEEIKSEIDTAVEEKRVYIQGKVDTYKAAQQHQLENGGSGPSAEFDIMKIVNEHDSEFEVEFTGRHI